MTAWFENIRRRWGHFRNDPDLEDEIRVHTEMELEDRLGRGFSEDQAKRLLNVELGKPRVAIENIRDQEFLTWLEGCYRDLILGLRSLRNHPIFSITAMLTLALGIGVNTLIFGLLYGLVLRPLPTDSPSELMTVGFASKADNINIDDLVTAKMFRALQRNLTSVRGISGWERWSVTVEDRQGSLRMYDAGLVTGNAFEVVPIHPYLGRLIAPFDDVRGGPASGWPVVLSYGFWCNHFGKDPAIVGKRIRVAENLVTVVGVTAPNFTGIWPGTDVKMYLPLYFVNVLTKQDLLDGPESIFGFSVIARRRPDVSPGQAYAEVSRLDHAWLEQFIPPKFQHDPYFEQAYMRALPARSGMATYITYTYTKPLYLMQGLVAVVLLLCCVNVGGLLMSKVHMRQREFAVRTALGARTSRLIRQYLIENLTIAIGGSALGALFASRMSGIVLHFFRDPMMGEPMQAVPDHSIIFFAGGLAVLTTLLFGVVPAWRAGHSNPGELLKARSTLGGKRHIAGRTFIPIQVALSVLLAAVASLLSQSVLKLRSEKTGFDTDHVTIQTSPLYLLDRKGEAKLHMYQEFVDRLNEMPDVRSAAVTSKTPMTGEEVMSRFQPLDSGSKRLEDVHLAFNDIGPGYFQTMRTPIVLGREFTKADRLPNVCVVNRSAAAFLFPHEDALGRYIRATDTRDFPHRPTCRIVGIAGDAKFSDVRQGPPPTIYFPVSLSRIDSLGTLVFLINSRTKASAIAAFRKTLAEKAPTVPPAIFVTLREQMDAALGSEELITLISNFFGLVSLLLSALGLYGLLSSSVAQRTGEIGMRVALGAAPASVIGMMLREALALVAIGLVAGWLGLILVGRLIAAMLHGVAPYDPLTLTAVAATIIIVSFIAALLPALRAATVDPMVALRVE
ncbi:MAG: ABC transporter permease [Bryobacteraceae bacterium]